jgi:hypothetical protein
MQTVNAYVYDNIVEVQFVDPTIFTTRNRVVYSRPIKIYQGIDNPVQVVIKNQDQKAIDLTGYAVQADIQDPVNEVTVASLAVTWVNITKGQGYFIVDRDLVNSLESRLYKLTLKRIHTSEGVERILYTDSNYAVPLDLEILPGYYARTEVPLSAEEYVVDGGTL